MPHSSSTRKALLILGMIGALLGFVDVSQEDVTPTAASSATRELVFEASSTFNRRVFVVDEGGYRSLRFGDINDRDQTRIRPGHPKQLPMPYLRSAAIGLAVPKKVDRLLMIGLGGGAFATFIQARFPDIYIDALEIDPVVARAATDFFGLNEDPKLQIHVVDAVDFVQTKRAAYDFIFLDAYDADQLPDALTTHRFFSDVKANLAKGGVVVANIAIKSDFAARAVAERLMGFYDFCLHLRSRPSLNDVLLLADQPLPRRKDLLQWVQNAVGEGATLEGMKEHIRRADNCR
ncbi:spermidine synthase [Congregibacter litoralis]|uniref:Spermidine synthase n=1 Tax=Congregibacter litoralis KT71 TaxID=314285 RepID=A4A6Z9_9GAMM|nr:fused MFS/spermidine synthase [Congregibacter litoralis]EAQ98068.1 Spermidine synthase [Congregibacter litoralis KT71]